MANITLKLLLHRLFSPVDTAFGLLGLHIYQLKKCFLAKSKTLSQKYPAQKQLEEWLK
jgi:hypothetical protein